MLETFGELASEPRDGETEDQAATLELQDGQIRVPVYYFLRPLEGGAVGYLRLAYGQGNAANRLLAAANREGRLVTPSGEARRILITSTDPSEAPGYLCAFTLD
jgi:hypothetical protein